ncbi:hypothetical protein BP6252_13969 [Coleophoma cylindrospora]|uniref:Uncharacterized protein n=1 Tax=Coleophoma cylindrospora TaxID=1849047 RepID=A0A3D8Q4I9_9HELO|nr:hypothetical protein BP6252_13969 [Coleophoma cylindrospora]
MPTAIPTFAPSESSLDDCAGFGVLDEVDTAKVGEVEKAGNVDLVEVEVELEERTTDFVETCPPAKVLVQQGLAGQEAFPRYWQFPMALGIAFQLSAIVSEYASLMGKIDYCSYKILEEVTARSY